MSRKLEVVQDDSPATGTDRNRVLVVEDLGTFDLRVFGPYSSGEAVTEIVRLRALGASLRIYNRIVEDPREAPSKQALEKNASVETPAGMGAISGYRRVR